MTGPLTEAQVATFAAEWVAAWNSRDLDQILRHYADDIDFTSPFIIRLLGDTRGRLRGRDALRAYFAQGLAAYPDLHFELLGAYGGVGSIVLHYRSVRNLLAAETMHFDGDGKVCRVHAHYAPAPTISSPSFSGQAEGAIVEGSR